MKQKELEELMHAHQAELQRYVRFLGADPSEAEDVVQDTFVASFYNKRCPDLDNVPVRISWLRTIARNTFLQYCRKKRKSLVEANSETMELAEKFWSQNMSQDSGFSRMEALQECLKKLSDKHKEVIEKRYQEQASRKEMAQAMNMSENGIKSLLRRIRLSLSDCIKVRLQEEAS